MSKSLYNIDKRCIFRQTFNNLNEVLDNGYSRGIITSGTVISFLEDSILFNSSYTANGIEYNTKFRKQISSIRAKFLIPSGTYVQNSEIYLYHITPSQFDFRMGLKFVSGKINLNVATVFAVLDFDVEYECVFVYSTTFNVYINGNLVYSGTLNATRNKYNKLNIGKNISTLLKLQLFYLELYDSVLTKEEVNLLYNNNLYSKLNTTIKDYTPNCFEGNNNAYIEVPDSDLLSFGDGVNDQSFWGSFWYYHVNGTYSPPISKYSNTSNGMEYRIILGSATAFQLYVYSGGNVSNFRAYPISIDCFLKLKHVCFYYNGTTVSVFENGVFKQEVNPATVIGTYVAMLNTSAPVWIAKDLSGGALGSNDTIFDVRIGSGTLSQQQVNAIYTGRRVGTERLWLPLCENAGNVRFDVSGNGLHGILKGTQDGKYNVGKQTKFDYYSLYGGSNVGWLFNSPALPQRNDGLWYVGSYGNTYLINGSQWTLGFRFIGNTISSIYSEFLLTQFNVAGNVVASSTLNGITIGFSMALSGRVGVRYFNTDIPFDGTGNSINTPTSTVADGGYHSMIWYSDGTNIHLILDAMYRGYVTPTSTLLQMQGFRLVDGIPYNGIFFDLTLWNNNIGQIDALLYHSNVFTTQPTHRYSLVGNNPNIDLIGGLNLLRGLEQRVINIPLKASDSTPVLPAITGITTTLPVVKRNFREAFRLDARQGVISDKYGAILTIGSSITTKGYGRVKGIYFPYTTNSTITFNSTQFNKLTEYGVIIKMWILMEKYVDFTAILLKRGSIPGSYGFYPQFGGSSARMNFMSNNTYATTPTGSFKYFTPTLLIGCIEKEMVTFYMFDKTGLVHSQNMISPYFFGNTREVAFGMDSRFQGFIFDVSISTAGILSLEEATQIFSNEKNNYF